MESFATDMVIRIDGNDDEETSVMDHLADARTPARRSTAGGVLLPTPAQAVANASTAGAGSKQSSLSTFFMMSSEKVSCWLQQVYLNERLCYLSTEPDFQSTLADFIFTVLYRRRV